MKRNARLINACVRRKSTSVSEHNELCQLTERFIDDKKSKEPRIVKPGATNLSTTFINSANSETIRPLDTPSVKINQHSPHWSTRFNAPTIPHNFESAFIPQPNVSNHCNENELEDTQCSTASTENPQCESNTEMRVNEINVQMLPRSLYRQIFKDTEKEKSVRSEKVQAIKQELSLYGINANDATRLDNVDLKLPPLEGGNIEEHFYNIAQAQIKPYVEIIKKLLYDIPEMPKQWLLVEGWTRYTPEKVEPVDFPLENGIVFDVEVCVKESPLPCMATAVTPKAWYGWVSKSLSNGSNNVFKDKSYTTNMMIPMESTRTENGQKLNSYHKKPKIVVGHNVSFDRARIKEQYWLNSTGTRFLDTMSMHIAVSGISSYQRALLSSNAKKKENSDAPKSELDETDWVQFASLNSLAEVSKLYCGLNLQKESRDIFVEGTLMDVRKDFQNLMTYCASDVVATHKVLCKLYPLFQSRFPHPVTLAGTLELGSVYLPVNTNWQKYIDESESTYEDLNYELKLTLAKRADAVCQLVHNDKYKEDLWMWDEDWTIRHLNTTKKFLQKSKKRCTPAHNTESKLDGKKMTDTEEEDEEPDPLKEEFAYLETTKTYLPKRSPHMPGYPMWYRNLCLKPEDPDWEPGPQRISTSMKIVPKLLKLTWNNFPLHYIKGHGWGILVPFNKEPESETKVPLKELFAHCTKLVGTEFRPADYDMDALAKDIEANLTKTEFWRYKKQTKKNEKENPLRQASVVDPRITIDDCCYFFKLPHPDGAKRNVGNPLSKDFLNKFAENVLAGVDASATQVLQIARMLTYWRNNRDRIMSQLVVWHPVDSLSSIMSNKKYIRYGAILPGVVASGTLTRRAVERTWLTASNAHADRIGSELRSMVQAPPGYHIIGADVDSQELWIASLLGDAHSGKIHGCTPFGWMTLIGTKSNGTDMHSVTAKAVGISRDHAKIINYARIYGAGQKFAETLLKQFNPSMSEADAAKKSRKMFALTKGRKTLKLKAEYADRSVREDVYTGYEAYLFAKAHNKKVDEMFENPVWVGGSESAMFNKLESIASTESPVTPFLDSRLTRALELANDRDKYLPTRINWVVQSGAVDFLHLMLVSMRWLMKDNARFCLSFHDEVRYLVPSRFKYNAALAMHVTNLLTRCFCASRVGMKDLPFSVAFFSSVEVDTVLRKDATDDSKTPSNPHGLENGYGIPRGEALDIYHAIQKANGSLGPWHK